MHVLDRRVAIISESAGADESIKFVSDLRDFPFVVLLGEPGIGKSTVLEAEAAVDGVAVTRVRGLLNGVEPPSDAVLYLDALDEYRTDGHAGDKIYQLAAAIKRSRVPRWRITCRSEDWRKEADIAPISSTTNGVPIIVAQILPLDYSEALSVLLDLGELDQKAFLDRALGFGAKGFTESPLSLRLLRAAVAEGEWPRTRFDLFDSAVERLSFERDRMRRALPRQSRHAIVSAASQACLLMLVSGAKSLWRSNDEPPRDQDPRAFVTMHDLALDRDLLRDTLDTALFRGEGEAFEPIHKTLAEFLAGKALAEAVRGSSDRAALPLRRALSLVATDDGAPPTDLRGVFAWFAAHLARIGDETGAIRLIEADAAVVLSYGDAAAFGPIGRRAILANLDRRDPYFRATEVGVTAVGGLSGEDLAQDFRAILLDPSDGTHRTITVLEALKSGAPIESLRPTLQSVALDPERSEWTRRRAVEAWMSGASDPDQAHREMFDALASEPLSVAREALRVWLAAKLPTAALPLHDLKAVIADYERCGEDNSIGRLMALSWKLEAEPRGDLFDAPVPSWRPEMDHRKRQYEVDSLLDGALRAAIEKTPELTAERLHQWLLGRWDYSLSQAGQNLRDTVRRWIDEEPAREVAFFESILASQTTDGPWFAANEFRSLVGRSPSAVIVLHLIGRSAAEVDASAKNKTLAIAVEIASDFDHSDRAYWHLYDQLVRLDWCGDLMSRLTQSKIKPWQIKDRNKRALKTRDEKRTRSKNQAFLTPLLAELRAGRYPDILSRCASLIYWQTERHDRSRMENLIYFTSDEIAGAISDGWKAVAVSGLNGASAAALGIAKACHRLKSAEIAAITGVSCLQLEGGCSSNILLPLSTALSVLKSSHYVQDEELNHRLLRWAATRLDDDPSIGSTLMLEYWNAALNAGSTDLDLLNELSGIAARDGSLHTALMSLLTTRPWIPLDALRSALTAIAPLTDVTWLRQTSELALSDARVANQQNIVWSYVLFALDPYKEEHRFLAELDTEEAVQRFEREISGCLADALGKLSPEASTYREAVMVNLLGPLCTPVDPVADAGLSRFEGRSATVRAAIKALQGEVGAEAGRLLANLVQDPRLANWRPEVRHAQAQQAAQTRDHNFQYPMPSSIHASVSGGPPINASDLQAVVMEEIERLRRELRTDDIMPWRHYWNRNSQGKVTTPLIENDCRDQLLERLRDRLARYHIAASIPEARRGDETRADILFLSHAGCNLPLEAKRHYHADIWLAASTQLQRYALSEGADGFGIYLVFWFGNEVSPTPSRPDGGDGPETAQELEHMLRNDLPQVVRNRLEVIVFDVSSPSPAKIVSPRKKRETKKTGSSAPGAGCRGRK